MSLSTEDKSTFIRTNLVWQFSYRVGYDRPQLGSFMRRDIIKYISKLPAKISRDDRNLLIALKVTIWDGIRINFLSRTTQGLRWDQLHALCICPVYELEIN